MNVQRILQEIRKIRAGLNPEEIRRAADRNLRIGLAASSEEGYRALERFLCPEVAENDAQERAASMIERVDLAANGLADPEKCDFILCEARVSLGPVPPNGYRFDWRDPSRTAESILRDHPDLELSLGRHFPRFRSVAVERIIQRISQENAMFSVVSALPNVIPNLLELPWAVGEFATDTAFITANQIRMALFLAAIHDRPVGYMEQKLQLAAIAGGAFGWRAVARELAGKIPLGGGLIPKAAISFAGTWVVGLGLDRVNRLGQGMSRAERREAWLAALEKGKAAARGLIPTAVR